MPHDAQPPCEWVAIGALAVVDEAVVRAVSAEGAVPQPPAEPQPPEPQPLPLA
jgi:hypothetical protein